MQKYRCVVCDYIYDLSWVIPIAASSREQPLKTSPKTGSVLSVVLINRTSNRPDRLFKNNQGPVTKRDRALVCSSPVFSLKLRPCQRS